MATILQKQQPYVEAFTRDYYRLWSGVFSEIVQLDPNGLVVGLNPDLAETVFRSQLTEPQIIIDPISKQVAAFQAANPGYQPTAYLKQYLDPGFYQAKLARIPAGSISQKVTESIPIGTRFLPPSPLNQAENINKAFHMVMEGDPSKTISQTVERYNMVNLMEPVAGAVVAQNVERHVREEKSDPWMWIILILLFFGVLYLLYRHHKKSLVATHQQEISTPKSSWRPVEMTHSTENSISSGRSVSSSRSSGSSWRPQSSRSPTSSSGSSVSSTSSAGTSTNSKI